MNKYLIIVDMQNDFIDGSLGSKEAQAIVPVAVERIEKLKKEGFQIIFTMDTHDANYLNTQEGKRLPVPHCVFSEKGWMLNEQISRAAQSVKTYWKNTFGCIDLARELRISDRNASNTVIEIMGLCTDICVVSNALLLKAFLPEALIRVNSSCCAGVTPEKHLAALETMRSCQIDVI